ncbi:DUF4357 domain-containing protein [Celerinatantimonas yamalensis]|uniref:DUF4357 domain-containing protein n=1 Tax=Celerinatantimonas yamalensis TaxID=559956 RepID=A0ABW9GA91_9GAMM
MSEPFDTRQVNFIVDAKGHRQAAIMPIRMYQQLLALQQLLDSSSSTTKPSGDFQFEVKQAKAFGYPVGSKTRPRFVVVKGSSANLGLTDSMRPAVRALREQLIADGVLAEGPNGYDFLRDYQFASPSLAACLIAGNARSGLDAWHDQWGRSLKERGYGKKQRSESRAKG